MSRFFTVKIGRNTKPPTEPAISSSELKQSREMIDLPSRSIHSFFAREKKKERKEGKRGRGEKIVSIARDVLHPTADSLIDSRSVLKRSAVNFDVSSMHSWCDIGRKLSFRAHSYNFFREFRMEREMVIMHDER